MAQDRHRSHGAGERARLARARRPVRDAGGDRPRRHGRRVARRGPHDRAARRDQGAAACRTACADDERKVFEERVLREARAAGRLNDPGVVTVYDVVQEAGSTFIVMELIQATTLSDARPRAGRRCRRTRWRGWPSSCCRRWRPRTRRVWCTGTSSRRTSWCCANGRVKLTDFGIAQSIDDPRLTTSGDPRRLARPTWPRSGCEGAEADAGSDLWALGGRPVLRRRGLLARSSARRRPRPCTRSSTRSRT